MLWEQRYSHDCYTGMHLAVCDNAELMLYKQLLASDSSLPPVANSWFVVTTY